MVIKMDYNFSELMTLLDWNNGETNQKKGREIAKSIKDLKIFYATVYK